MKASVGNRFFNRTNKANTTTGNTTDTNSTQSGTGGIHTESLSQPYLNSMVKVLEINGTANFSRLGETIFFEQVQPAANV